MGKCAFCYRGIEANRICGKLYCHPRGVSAHRKCMQYTSGMCQYKDTFQKLGGFKYRDVLKVQKKAKALRCPLCKDKHGCASAGCEWSKCRKSFHFYCAKLKGLTSHWKIEDNKGTTLDCPEHEDNYMATEKGKKETCVKRSSNVGTTEDAESTEDSDDLDDGSGNLDSLENELEESTRHQAEKPVMGTANGLKTEEKSSKDTSPESCTEAAMNDTPSASHVSPKSCKNKTPLIKQKDRESVTDMNVPDHTDPDSSSSNCYSPPLLYDLSVASATDGNDDIDDSDTSLPPINTPSKRGRFHPLVVDSSFQSQLTDETEQNLNKNENEMSNTPGKHRKRKLSTERKSGENVPETSQSDANKNDSEKRIRFTRPSQDGQDCEANQIKRGKNGNYQADLSDGAPGVSEIGEADMMENVAVRPLQDPSTIPAFEEQHLTDNSEGGTNTSFTDDQGRMFIFSLNNPQGGIDTSFIKDEPLRTNEPDNVLPDTHIYSDSWSSVAANEFVLVIPTNPKLFHTVESEVQRKVTEEFGVDKKDVYFWNAITPVPLPASCMLHFFYDIAETLQAQNWDGLQLLLLDAETIESKRDEEYPRRFYEKQGLLKGEQELEKTIRSLLWKIIENVLQDGCSKNGYLLGVLSPVSTSSGFNNITGENSKSGIEAGYLALVINIISDPQQNLRRALHNHETIYNLPTILKFTKFDRWIPPEQQEALEVQESTIIWNWFSAANFTQLHKLDVLPVDKVLKSTSSASLAFSAVESRLQSLKVVSKHDEDVDNLPVIVLVNKMNTSLVHVEPFLQASLAQYIEDVKCRRVVCLFHVDNDMFRFRQCPLIDLGRPDWLINFFSAFDPTEKQISVLIADLSRE